METDMLQKQRKLLIYISKKLYKSGLYDLSLKSIKQAIDMDSRLTQKHRIFFLNLIQNIINPFRATLKHLKENISKDLLEKKNKLTEKISLIYQNQFNLFKITSQDILSIIDQQLLLGNILFEEKIDFLRIQADLYRYLSEYSLDNQKKFFITRADSVYQQAYELAQNNLPSYSLSRLALIMNRAIFLAEILKKPLDAVLFSEFEINNILNNENQLSEASYQKAMIFVRKLTNKIIQWKE